MTEIKIQAQGSSETPVLDWLPQQADFDEILIGKKAKFDLELTNKDSVEAVLFVVSEPTDEYVKKYKIKRDKLNPDQATGIEFELRDDIPPGMFTTALTLEIKDRPDTRITIPVVGKVVEKLSEKKPETQAAAADKAQLGNQKAVSAAPKAKTEDKSGSK